MEPRIQYAKTKDGVSIAFATVGNGRPLVGMPSPGFSHVELQWETFGYFWKPLAQAFRVVMYDSRGAGLSDREATDFSMEAITRDLEAVVEQAGLGSFALLAMIDAVPTAVSYAASHPDRVSHLIICDGWTRFSDYAESPAYQIESTVRETDWVLFTETFAQMLWGLESPDLTRQSAEFMRACVEPEAWRSAQVAFEGYDASALLPNVTAPTLVVHNRKSRWLPLQCGQRIAAGIRDARFVPIDDMTWAPVPELIKEFLGEGEEAGAPPGLPSGDVHTILFTDVEGSTALTQRLGDAKARELLREHERMVREALNAHGGSEVKTMGDGFMTSFSSATKALDCAIAMQRAFADWNARLTAHPEPVEGSAAAHGSTGSPRAAIGKEPIRVRIGLNAGEPIAEDDPDGRGDLYGTAVNRAARISATAQGGEILVANVVRELAEGKDFLFADRGEVALKGFEEPVRLYEVKWRA